MQCHILCNDYLSTLQSPFSVCYTIWLQLRFFNKCHIITITRKLVVCWYSQQWACQGSCLTPEWAAHSDVHDQLVMFMISYSKLFVLPSKEEYNHMQCSKFWIVNPPVFGGSYSVWLGGRRSWTDICTWTYHMHADLLCGEPAPVCFHCGTLPTVSHILIKCQFYFECCRFHIQDTLHSFVGSDHWIVYVTFLHSLPAYDLPSQLFVLLNCILNFILTSMAQK